MLSNDLYENAKKIIAAKKGILASDERPSSADKNLEKAGVAPTPEIRKKYRELFINTPDIEKYLNGIIIQNETFWQEDTKGKLFRDTLIEKDIMVIIKVDEGTVELPKFPGEEITLGLDYLEERLEKYHQYGARGAKWRSVIKIGKDLPTLPCLEANAVGLAEYSLFCQKCGIVPIVEPEVLFDGDHTIEQCEAVSKLTLNVVFDALKKYNVDLRGVILKSSMVLPGKNSTQKKTSEEIANATVRTLLASVPKELPGIIFLSGGQSPEEATLNLNTIAKKEPLPWEIAFSYLRAIEGPPAQLWQGKDENLEIARNEFIKRLRLNVLADAGVYDPNFEANF